MPYPFRQARWFQPANRGNGDIDLIVLHCPQFPELNDSAERLAAYFATTDRKASTHAVCDNDSLWECVRDHDVAYGAANANRRGLHIEVTGYAEQTEQQWLDPYSMGAMRQAAGWVRAKSDLYHVPRRFLTLDQLADGDDGLTTHADVERVWPSTGHHDPGAYFPRAVFLDMLDPVDAPDDLEALLLWT